MNEFLPEATELVRYALGFTVKTVKFFDDFRNVRLWLRLNQMNKARKE